MHKIVSTIEHTEGPGICPELLAEAEGDEEADTTLLALTSEPETVEEAPETPDGMPDCEMVGMALLSLTSEPETVEEAPEALDRRPDCEIEGMMLLASTSDGEIPVEAAEALEMRPDCKMEDADDAVTETEGAPKLLDAKAVEKGRELDERDKEGGADIETLDMTEAPEELGGWEIDELVEMGAEDFGVETAEDTLSTLINTAMNIGF
jgi:hypothetical protein